MRTLDPDSFVNLLPVVQHRVRAFIAAIMPRSSEIDEVLQSTLVVAWKKLGDFRYSNLKPDDEFVRWLCAIARFEALALARKRGDERLVFDDRILDQIVDMQVTDNDTWERRRIALRGCVDKLACSDRALVEQIYGGVPVVDIAASAGKTRQAIYKALRRVRRNLMSCIQAQLQAWEI